MDWVDWIVLAVLAGSVFAGMVQGFFRTVCSLLGLILGVLLASWNYAALAGDWKQTIPSEAVANALAFFVIAASVLLLGNLCGMLFQKIFHWMGLGCLDTLGGAVAGLVQGALLVMAAILVTVAFFPQTQWLTRAQFPQIFFRSFHGSANMSPDAISGRVREDMKLLQRTMPRWLHENNGGS